jgi:hypothetical protein
MIKRNTNDGQKGIRTKGHCPYVLMSLCPFYEKDTIKHFSIFNNAADVAAERAFLESGRAACRHTDLLLFVYPASALVRAVRWTDVLCD